MGTIADVQRSVLRQHSDLRARMLGLATLAARVATDPEAETLDELLDRLIMEFREHLDFEERELVPHIRAVDAWGPVRESMILAEHADQRRSLEAARTRATSEPPVGGDLEREVLALVRRLLHDMKEEERVLAQLAEIEDVGHGDFFTG